MDVAPDLSELMLRREIARGPSFGRDLKGDLLECFVGQAKRQGHGFDLVQLGGLLGERHGPVLAFWAAKLADPIAPHKTEHACRAAPNDFREGKLSKVIIQFALVLVLAAMQ